MDLKKAIVYIIDKEGIEFISNPRFVNYLSDLQAFDLPSIKRIFLTLIDNGYSDRLKKSLPNKDCELQFNTVENLLIQNEGFQPNLVSFALESLLYAAQETGNTPFFTPTERKSKVVPKNISKVTNSVHTDFNVLQKNGDYVVTVNGNSYELNESQYKAIMRKKDMPTDRLEIWLSTYAEENK